MRDRTAATSVLQNALSLMPQFGGEVHAQYKEMSPWDNFMDFMGRKRNLDDRQATHAENLETVGRYMGSDFPGRCKREGFFAG